MTWMLFIIGLSTLMFGSFVADCNSKWFSGVAIALIGACLLVLSLLIHTDKI